MKYFLRILNPRTESKANNNKRLVLIKHLGFTLIIQLDYHCSKSSLDSPWKSGLIGNHTGHPLTSVLFCFIHSRFLLGQRSQIDNCYAVNEVLIKAPLVHVLAFGKKECIFEPKNINKKLNEL